MQENKSLTTIYGDNKMITVLGYDGQKIGEASNFSDAKAMNGED